MPSNGFLFTSRVPSIDFWVEYPSLLDELKRFTTMEECEAAFAALSMNLRLPVHQRIMEYETAFRGAMRRCKKFDFKERVFADFYINEVRPKSARKYLRGLMNLNGTTLESLILKATERLLAQEDLYQSEKPHQKQRTEQPRSGGAGAFDKMAPGTRPRSGGPPKGNGGPPYQKTPAPAETAPRDMRQSTKTADGENLAVNV